MTMPEDEGRPARDGPGQCPAGLSSAGVAVPRLPSSVFRWIRLDSGLMAPVASGALEPKVWKVHLDQPDEMGWWWLLSEAERARALRLACPLAQHRYVVAHAALRAILGDLCGVRAAQLKFRTEATGRPYLELPGRQPPLDFNLSHAGEWALVGVTDAGWRVGVDIEEISPDLDYLAMARRLYQPAEVERLRQVDPVARRMEYFLFWSAKEAYVKAVGVGLAGFRDVLVSREVGSVHGTVLSRSAPGSVWPVRWLEVGPGYTGAVVSVASIAQAAVVNL